MGADFGVFGIDLGLALAVADAGLGDGAVDAAELAEVFDSSARKVG